MITNLTPKDLIEFEEDVIKWFERKKILAPVHLDHNNQDQLIKIFQHIKEEDWVCCTWRSHYKCLLKGVSRFRLMRAILRGKSISLNFPDKKIVSSAIVGGICPIALGLALAEKRKKSGNKVWLCIGDMTSLTGAFHETYQYAMAQNLDLYTIIEDNGKSVCTDTYKTWGLYNNPYIPSYPDNTNYRFDMQKKIVYYKYESKYPHSGGLNRIQF